MIEKEKQIVKCEECNKLQAAQKSLVLCVWIASLFLVSFFLSNWLRQFSIFYVLHVEHQNNTIHNNNVIKSLDIILLFVILLIE